MSGLQSVVPLHHRLEFPAEFGRMLTWVDLLGGDVEVIGDILCATLCTTRVDDSRGIHTAEIGSDVPKCTLDFCDSILEPDCETAHDVLARRLEQSEVLLLRALPVRNHTGDAVEQVL